MGIIFKVLMGLALGIVGSGILSVRECQMEGLICDIVTLDCQPLLESKFLAGLARSHSKIPASSADLDMGGSGLNFVEHGTNNDDLRRRHLPVCAFAPFDRLGRKYLLHGDRLPVLRKQAAVVSGLMTNRPKPYLLVRSVDEGKNIFSRFFGKNPRLDVEMAGYGVTDILDKKIEFHFQTFTTRWSNSRGFDVHGHPGSLGLLSNLVPLSGMLCGIAGIDRSADSSGKGEKAPQGLEPSRPQLLAGDISLRLSGIRSPRLLCQVVAVLTVFLGLFLAVLGLAKADLCTGNASERRWLAFATAGTVVLVVGVVVSKLLRGW